VGAITAQFSIVDRRAHCDANRKLFCARYVQVGARFPSFTAKRFSVSVPPQARTPHERKRERYKEGKEKREKNKDRSQARWHVRAALRALDFISHQAFLLAVSDTEKACIWLRSRQKIRRKQVCS
jgi:hypothetical protein